MFKLLITSPQMNDVSHLLLLYQTVANIHGSLARTRNEITEEYVRHNLLTSCERGLSLISRIDELGIYGPTFNLD